MNIQTLNQTIVQCEKCPRLRSWCETVAQEKRKSFINDVYWGKPVPGFGDIHAQVLMIGLAPAAHGANRTGRMFTGDNSGKWVYRALFEHGFSNGEDSVHAKDSLRLKNAYVTAAVRCAPPDNKPNPQETSNCLPYLQSELKSLKAVKIIVVFGSFAWNALFQILKDKEFNFKKPKFGHGLTYKIGPYHVVGSYHPSQQNTFTGRLTKPMFDHVFKTVKELL